MMNILPNLLKKSKDLGYKTVEQMLKDLYENNSGVNDVGIILEVSGMTVYNYLKKFNIKIKNRGGNPPQFNWKLIAKQNQYEEIKPFFFDLIQKYSFAQLAIKFECSISTIYRAYKKYNIDAILNKRKRRSMEKVYVGVREINKNKDIKLCSCCGLNPVKKGLKFLCSRCYRNED